jgi:hypothetical protein
MKKLLYLGLALLTFALHGCGPTSVIVESRPAPPPPPPPPAPEASYQSFYDALSPYGQWINNPEYGYVWMPSVAPDFTPYGSNGHWVLTDQGWTWDSDYPWGWAAFHYGRWFFEDGYGWMWIPGSEWAPAWVSWRRSPDYYGWAPLGPQVSISASYSSGYNPPPHYWHFVPQQYVASPQVNNYVVNEQQNVTIVRNTTIIRNTTINNTTVNNTTIVNNTVNNNVTNNNVNNRVTVNNYAGGPDPAEVSRVSGTTLRPIPLRESNRPGENSGNGSLSIYRPRINQPSASGGGGSSAAAPPRVQPLNQVHPINQTRYNNAHPFSPSNASPGTPSANGGNPAFNGNANNNGNNPNNGSNANNPANPNATANPNNNGNTGYPRNGGNPNTNGNPANTGNNPNSGSNPNHPPNPANTGAPRTVNNPAAPPVNNTPPASHPVYARPGTTNPAQVRTQPGTAKPQPTVGQPQTNNQPGVPKRITPVTRPLTQAPAGNQPKKDDKNKDDKDKKDKPNNQR